MYQLDILILQDDGAAGCTRNIDRNLLINRNKKHNLMKSCQLIFSTLGVIHFKETRNVLKIFSSLTSNNGFLTTADRREIALHIRISKILYQKQFPCDSTISRRNTSPSQGTKCLHINAVTLDQTLILLDIFIRIAMFKCKRGQSRRRFYSYYTQKRSY